MSGSTPEYKLAGVSVVIVAQDHNPQLVNPDFLKKNGIVENDWEVDHEDPSFVSLPWQSSLSFKNGIRWQVDLGRCIITEKIEGTFKGSYSVHECAKKYTDALKHISYIALGMNWRLRLSVSEEKLQNWLKTRFLKSGGWQKSIEWARFTFKDSSYSPQCSFTLNAQNGAISCNFHTDLSSESDRVGKMHSELDNFEKHQDFLKESLDKYFLEDL